MKKQDVASKMVKVKSKGKPFKFYRQHGRDGVVHVGAFKEKKGKESLRTAKGGHNEGDTMSLGRRGIEQPRA